MGIFSIALAAEMVLVIAPQALAVSAFRRIGVSSPEPSAALTVRAMRHSILLTGAGSLILLPIVFVGVPWAVGAGYEDVPLLYVLLIPHALCWAAMTSLYTFFQVQAKQAGCPAQGERVHAGHQRRPDARARAAWDMWGVAIASSLAGVVGAAWRSSSSARSPARGCGRSPWPRRARGLRRPARIEHRALAEERRRLIAAR